MITVSVLLFGLACAAVGACAGMLAVALCVSAKDDKRD